MQFFYQETLFFSGGPVSEEQFSLNCLSEFSLRMPVAVGSKTEILDFLRAHNLRICGSGSKNAVPFWEEDFTNGVALLLGSEREGLGPFWIENQDESLVIPMSGSAGSLNLSVSAACFLSEAARQRSSQ